MKMELRRRALDKIYKRRDRIDMPDFQREEVWTEDQKRRLIDTILKGWHLPKFYFRKTEILSAIGAGGMGEVYRARDPKLGRDIARYAMPARPRRATHQEKRGRI